MVGRCGKTFCACLEVASIEQKHACANDANGMFSKNAAGASIFYKRLFFLNRALDNLLPSLSKLFPFHTENIIEIRIGENIRDV